MSRRILIVEDEPNIVDALSFLLMREGYDVLSEGDGGNAITAIAEHAPELVILDAMLPGRSGFDILQDLRTSGSKIPVLMLTAKGQAKDKQRASDAGASKFMVKPFSNADIIASVAALLEGT